MESRAEIYATKHLLDEIRAIESSRRKDETPELDVFEKAIIYKYSTDGYKELNEHLRENGGKDIPEFGQLLDEVLAKLNDFKGLVYRAADLNSPELAGYKTALRKNLLKTEPCFLSTTKIRTFATYLNLNTTFRIMSKTGKEINKIAKFGIYEPPDEGEVLFRLNLEFRVLDITKEKHHTLITMEEV